MEIRCASTACDFIGDRPLPVLTVDEAIYRRLPAFLIATVDKFASLPWVAETGAFFGHVDRFDAGVGFYGAAEPRLGRPLGNGWTLDPPDLIIQDELHLISGPLGTIAGLYEAAIDQLASRGTGDHRVRPKIVASTATVRRAEAQIVALFDRPKTCMFPPAGIDRTDSFFARTVPSSRDPARLYVGIAAQGRGPKLVFLRALTTLLSAAEAEFEAAERAGIRPNPADPYMTALCYFNALRQLGGARRIVEDEVRDRVQRYGAQRVRLDPRTTPFANRQIAEPMELTSRKFDRQSCRGQAAVGCSFRGQRANGRCCARDQHDFGWSRHRSAWPDACSGPGQNRRRIHSDDKPRRARLEPSRRHRHSAECTQAPRPHALRTVWVVSPQLLPRRRGDKRHALGFARSGPGIGGNRGRDDPAHRYGYDAGTGGR